ncbi:MAG: hypothetical protein WCG27_02150, partial [Pseudomonadota bacterium]
SSTNNLMPVMAHRTEVILKDYPQKLKANPVIPYDKLWWEISEVEKSFSVLKNEGAMVYSNLHRPNTVGVGSSTLFISELLSQGVGKQELKTEEWLIKHVFDQTMANLRELTTQGTINTGTDTATSAHFTDFNSYQFKEIEKDLPACVENIVASYAKSQRQIRIANTGETAHKSKITSSFNFLKQIKIIDKYVNHQLLFLDFLHANDNSTWSNVTLEQMMKSFANKDISIPEKERIEISFYINKNILLEDIGGFDKIDEVTRENDRAISYLHQSFSRLTDPTTISMFYYRHARLLLQVRLSLIDKFFGQFLTTNTKKRLEHEKAKLNFLPKGRIINLARMPVPEKFELGKDERLNECFKQVALNELNPSVRDFFDAYPECLDYFSNLNQNILSAESFTVAGRVPDLDNHKGNLENTDKEIIDYNTSITHIGKFIKANNLSFESVTQSILDASNNQLPRLRYNSLGKRDTATPQNLLSIRSLHIPYIKQYVAYLIAAQGAFLRQDQNYSPGTSSIPRQNIIKLLDTYKSALLLVDKAILQHKLYAGVATIPNIVAKTDLAVLNRVMNGPFDRSAVALKWYAEHYDVHVKTLSFLRNTSWVFKRNYVHYLFDAFFRGQKDKEVLFSEIATGKVTAENIFTIFRNHSSNYNDSNGTVTDWPVNFSPAKGTFLEFAGDVDSGSNLLPSFSLPFDNDYQKHPKILYHPDCLNLLNLHHQLVELIWYYSTYPKCPAYIRELSKLFNDQLME